MYTLVEGVSEETIHEGALISSIQQIIVIFNNRTFKGL